LFGRDNKKLKWKVEYDYQIYKIYDSDKKLAGYFFPQYSSLRHQKTSGKFERQEEQEEEDDDKIIEEMNKSHDRIGGGNLMVPMLRLNLFDNTEGMDLNYTIEALDANLQRAKTWREWLELNHKEFGISGAAIYTAREDRNMLSIVIGINLEMMLGERELGIYLTPLLDKLHTDGML
jgi:hypothetical protein